MYLSYYVFTSLYILIFFEKAKYILSIRSNLSQPKKKSQPQGVNHFAKTLKDKSAILQTKQLLSYL